jgi:VWFA-related protein
MKPTLIAAAVLALSAPQAVFRGGTTIVTIDAAVADGRRAVTNLTGRDFEVRDNGVAQQVLEFGREAFPLDVTLTIDLSGSMTPEKLASVKHAIGQVSAALRPEDRCGVVTFTSRVVDLLPLQHPPLDLSLPATRPAGGTSIVEATLLALVTPPLTDRRQLGILMTDGDDTTSFFDVPTTIETAKYANTQLSTVLAQAGRKTDDGLMLTLLRTVAKTTGGEVIEIDEKGDLGSAFMTAIENFRTSYVLRYVPTGVPRSGWHDVEVAVKGKKYSIRARRGYWGG